jgi:hypothetical protein
VDIEQNTVKTYVKKGFVNYRNCIGIYIRGNFMSKMGNWILEQEEAGDLVYVDGKGYVPVDEYAQEFMKTEQFENEFDKAFGNPLKQIDDIIDGLGIGK